MLVSKSICDQLSDRDIVRRSAVEMDYFSCLYERYEQRLLRYIRRLTLASETEASDILQEAFIKIWIHLNGYDPNLPFSSWMYRIVHNQAVSYIRQKKAFGRDQQVAWDDQLFSDFAEEQAEEQARELELKDEHTHRLLSELPLPYREVLMLRFLENMSYEDISDVLKIPEGTVATRINRAKKAFAQLVDHQKLVP